MRRCVESLIPFIVERLVQAHAATFGKGLSVCVWLLIGLPTVVLMNRSQVNLVLIVNRLISIDSFAWLMLLLLWLACLGRYHFHTCSFASVLRRAERSYLGLIGELRSLIRCRYTGISGSGCCFLSEVRIDIGSSSAGMSRFTSCLLLLFPHHFLHFERSSRAATLPSR